MKFGIPLRFAILLPAVALVAACSADGNEIGETSVPTNTPTASPTQTPTTTPTQTHTPTATAPPAVVTGDPRALILGDPVRQSGAPCGFVDTLDFPLDPPDGARASGGGDYGRYRSRFDGYHTGEDWRVGASSFGQPVYSIGHGQVVYAQPNGWGADKGVVIVQHTFRDRRRVLSFYGHLDPPSIELRAGQCVERGDQVGDIGDPRSPPHLHFEIRLHLPDTPGPGYWSINPTRAGWRPPSATIWNERMGALPGVQWTHLNGETPFQALGIIDDSLLVISGSEEILALELESSRQLWSQTLPGTAAAAQLDANGELIYVASAGGTLEGFSISEVMGGASGTSVQPLWSVNLEAGSFDLVPFPVGGIVASSRSGTTLISDQGREIWYEEDLTGIVDAAETTQGLLLLARDGVWLADNDGISRWTDAISGQEVVASDQPFVYTDIGIYDLDLDSHSTQLFYDLAEGFPRSGDLINLPGGGILVAHLDRDDKRLIAVADDGRLIWESSISGLNSRAIEFVILENQPYMLIQHDLGNATGLDLFRIDIESGVLTRIFSGGTRASVSSLPEIIAEGNSLLISIPRVGLVAFDPQLAADGN